MYRQTKFYIFLYWFFYIFKVYPTYFLPRGLISDIFTRFWPLPFAFFSHHSLLLCMHCGPTWCVVFKSVAKLVYCTLKWLIIVPNDAFCIQATTYAQFFFQLIYFKRANGAVPETLKRLDVCSHACLRMVNTAGFNFPRKSSTCKVGKHFRYFRGKSLWIKMFVPFLYIPSKCINKICFTTCSLLLKFKKKVGAWVKMRDKLLLKKEPCIRRRISVSLESKRPSRYSLLWEYADFS